MVFVYYVPKDMLIEYAALNADARGVSIECMVLYCVGCSSSKERVDRAKRECGCTDAVVS